MSSERRKLVLGASWTLGSTLVALGVGAVFNPALVLYIGVGGYGVWASATAIASLFGILGDLGVAAALTKSIAEGRGSPAESKSLTASALVFGFLAGCAAGAALAGLSFYMSGYLGYGPFPLLLQLQAIQMPFNVGGTSLLALLQGRREFRKLALFTIGHSLANLFLVLAFLELGLGIPGVMIAALLTSVLLFLVLLASIRRALSYGGARELRADVRRMVPFGLSVTATNALSTVLYQVDTVAVSFFVRDPWIVGAYALAVFVTRSLWVLPGSISTTTYPVIAEYAAANDRGRVSRYLSTAMVASIAMTGVLASALVVFGRPALRFVFGPSSEAAFDFAVLLLVGTASFGSLRAVATSLTAVGRPDVGLRISGLGAATLLATSLALTGLWGARGAAIAVSLSFVLVAVSLTRSINRYVLNAEPGLLSGRRASLTAAIAAVAGATSLAFAEPVDPGAVSLIIGVLYLAGVSLALLSASGGRETWATFFRKSEAAKAEQG